MSGEGELIGDLAQAALTGRALEPTHGEGDDGHTHEATCLNCGAALAGKHCHNCGQAAHVHKTLGAFFHDLLHGVFHFEGKIWRTLPMLAWQPGRLTRQYIDGRRASYVSPIALFLFSVFLTFALFSALGNTFRFEAGPQSAATARAESEKQLTRLQQRKAAATAKGETISGIDEEIEDAQATYEVAKSIDQGTLPAVIEDAKQSDSISSLEPLNHAWRKARQNPELLVYKLQSNAYKYSWLLIPLSVPFVWLLFPFNRRFGLYDHTIFVTYSLCFMLLLSALISLAIVWNAGGWAIGVLALYAPFHLYRQIRHTYETSRFGAWWRTWFLSGFGVVVLVLFAVAVTMLVASD